MTAQVAGSSPISRVPNPAVPPQFASTRSNGLLRLDLPLAKTDEGSIYWCKNSAGQIHAAASESATYEADR